MPTCISRSTGDLEIDSWISLSIAVKSPSMPTTGKSNCSRLTLAGTRGSIGAAGGTSVDARVTLGLTASELSPACLCSMLVLIDASADCPGIKGTPTMAGPFPPVFWRACMPRPQISARLPFHACIFPWFIGYGVRQGSGSSSRSSYGVLTGFGVCVMWGTGQCAVSMDRGVLDGRRSAGGSRASVNSNSKDSIVVAQRPPCLFVCRSRKCELAVHWSVAGQPLCQIATWVRTNARITCIRRGIEKGMMHVAMMMKS